MKKIILKQNLLIDEENYQILYDNTNKLRINLKYKIALGGGERFHTLNLKGHRIHINVEEKFCEQFDKTYCPIPFFMTDAKIGIYVETGKPFDFIFGEDYIIADVEDNTYIYIFNGNYQDMLSEFMSIFGRGYVPPKETFLPWISANHWDAQWKVEKQLELIKKYDFPVGVVVIEAWSDESTFYIFNGAKYKPKENAYFSYDDFSFEKNGPWPNPKAMIDKFHAEGIKVILWQIPVYKHETNLELVNHQNELDKIEAIKNNFVVKTKNGEPYKIPKGKWFEGSMIPDFTNKEAEKDWFSKRKYLLDIGIDGFKTDGGEFIYDEDVIFSNGGNGSQMKNYYPQLYTSAYTNFIGRNRILFSRAGYSGQHMTPILWAGDQKSTFGELKAQLLAGLSAAMSSIIFWGFDIAGFAGKLPDADLYLRATQLATFCPVMQWHSEPDGGQFSALMASDDIENERSPWNIAEKNNDSKLLERTRIYHRLRKEIYTQVYDYANKAVKNNLPLMVPLVFEFPDDLEAIDVNDQFIFISEYLVAPILEPNKTEREVYLPKGKWKNIWNNEILEGCQKIRFNHEWHIPVYKKVKEGN